MRSIDVQAALLRHAFPPEDGWEVSLDLDPLQIEQLASGDREHWSQWFLHNALLIGRDAVFPGADLVARHPTLGQVVVVLSGDEANSRLWAVKVMLGHLLMEARVRSHNVHYAIAVPADDSWTAALLEIPTPVREQFGLLLLSVAAEGPRALCGAELPWVAASTHVLPFVRRSPSSLDAPTLAHGVVTATRHTQGKTRVSRDPRTFSPAHGRPAVRNSIR